MHGEKRRLLLDGDVISDPAEFTLEANPSVVIGARVNRVERGATLGIGVVVVILKQMSKMIISFTKRGLTLKSPAP
jgi:hypothetical protein